MSDIEHQTESAADERLLAEITVLLHRISRWTVDSWKIRANARARSDAVFALVQRLADVAADAEHQPRRNVPRLDELMLVDQLTVMVHDVVNTGSVAAWQAGLAAVSQTRAELFDQP
ncbi:MAG TPA: hypothetical protein VIS06_16940 [Mycobacteriales bacterium]|jgi:hypothetical protein